MTVTEDDAARRPVTDDRTAPEPLWRGRSGRWIAGLGLLAVWIGVWSLTQGRQTLALPGRDHTELHNSLTGFRDSVLASRDTNPVIRFSYWLGEKFGELVDLLQRMVSIPNFPRPVPEIGWLGVTAIAVWIALLIAGWRMSLLVAATFCAFGVFGYWSDSIDLLIITFVAVAVVVVIGMPIAVWIASSARASAVIELLLDLMQTMPTFVYLLPIVLFFGIGAPAAVVCTLIYALPPLIRIAGHGIRSVSATTIEATDSVGQTPWQRLVKVQLPMARRTIVVGLNQTTMAALAMATLAAFVDGPGLGGPVLDALVKRDVGGALVPGALIVLMAVMLDRVTTAASERSELVARGAAGDQRLHRWLVIGGGVLALVAVYLSRTYSSLAQWEQLSLGRDVADWLDRLVASLVEAFSGFTSGLKDVLSYGLLNPMQDLLAESPWWLAGLAIMGFAYIFGGLRAVVPTVLCLAGIWYLDLWHDAMITLNMTLVATLMVMVLALVFGVWMARQRAVDLVMRPLLDMGQTIPPFVYLIPALAFFGVGRFTAIVAAVIYAAPAAIKLVADGVRSVDVGTLEASRSTGATTWQEITTVQLPMARASLVLAANQGLLYVLAMVVIGGMVGAQALGYDVVLGFSRSEEWGKGAAAGLTIVLLGIMVDRIARAAAQRRPERISAPRRRAEAG